MANISQTAVVSARISLHMQAWLQQEAGLLGASLSAVVEEALTRWLEMRRGGAGPALVPPIEQEPMSTTEAIWAFHKALRDDDELKDQVAKTWLQFRADTTSRGRAAANVIPITRRSA
jgi:hypothetical protein